MKQRHLRLVTSHCKKCIKQDLITFIYEKLKHRIECILISKNEKLYLIKGALTEIYRDYELTTGIMDIPYFIKAEKRISQIIRDRKINYYYIKLKKFYKKI